METNKDNMTSTSVELEEYPKNGDNNESNSLPQNGIENVQKTTDTPKLSKNQQKKLLKKQKWEEGKTERKRKEREKLKRKKAEKRALGEPVTTIINRKRLRDCTMANSSCKQRVVIDLDFEHLMHERDLGKCMKQLHRSYSVNRRADNPMQFYLSSLQGNVEACLAKSNGYKNWDVYFRSEKYTELFPKEDLVYLSSDSENVIENLDETKVYVIGGLVDHNNHKGICHNLANEKGISHGRLPIDEYIEMKTRKVLTIDHVFTILLEVTHGKSWKEAFLAIIPARKGAVAKDDTTDSEENVDDIEENNINDVSNMNNGD